MTKESEQIISNLGGYQEENFDIDKCACNVLKSLNDHFMAIFRIY